MSKKVISFRLSDRQLADLDEACRRFGENRSEVVSRGIKALLEEYVNKDGTLIRRTPWFLTPLAESGHDQN